MLVNALCPGYVLHAFQDKIQKQNYWKTNVRKYKIYLAYRCYDLGDCAASDPSADELSESVSAHASQGKYHVFCIYF